jgi:diaminopimelate epimerase
VRHGRLRHRPLSITINEDGRAIMRGPARHVFSGTAARQELARR